MSIHGILAAISTPFTADGSIDEQKLRSHIDWVIENGIHGIVPGGSTGEVAALTLDERKQLHEITIDQVGKRVPVAPHVGSTRTEDAVELARHAKSLGADAVLAIMPFYEPPTREEVFAYYKAIGEADIEIIAYNLPAVTGMNLDREFYTELTEHTDKVTYIKDTSGDLEQALDLVYNHGDKVTTLVGLDTIVLPALISGAAGSIWGAPNFAPKECAAIYDLAKEGKIEEAYEIFRRIWNVLDFLGKEGYAVATKEAATIAGHDLGDPRAPYSRLPEEKRADLEQRMKDAGLTAS